MRAFQNGQTRCNDRWLSALLDAIEEVEALRADDICRGAHVPEGLVTQLRGRGTGVGPVHGEPIGPKITAGGSI